MHALLLDATNCDKKIDLVCTPVASEQSEIMRMELIEH